MKDNIKLFFYKNRKFSVIIAISLLIILSFIGFNIYIKTSKIVIKIDNQKIYKEEFMLYLYNQKKYFESTGGIDIWQTPFDSISAKDVAKNNAVSNLILIKTVSSQAKNLGINLTYEEKQNLEQQAKKLKEEVLNIYPDYNITLKDCKRYIEDNILENKVFSYITDGYQINEDDFEKFYNEEMKNMEQNYKKIVLDYINVPKSKNYDGKEIINQIFNEINQNTNFESYSKEENVIVETNVTLEEGMFEIYVYDILYKLNKGSISNIIETANNFYIFKINQVTDYSANEIKEAKRQEYILIEKNKIYYDQIRAWQDNIKIEKNDAVINNIDILSCE